MKRQERPKSVFEETLGSAAGLANLTSCQTTTSHGPLRRARAPWVFARCRKSFSGSHALMVNSACRRSTASNLPCANEGAFRASQKAGDATLNGAGTHSFATTSYIVALGIGCPTCRLADMRDGVARGVQTW